MRLLFTDYAGTVPTLAGPINNTAVVLVLQAGQGALLPNPGQNQYFIITMIPASTGLPGEIMWCTSRATDTLTVIRGQEGTTATAYLAGDSVAPQVTANALAAFAQTPTYAGNPNGLLAGQAGSAEQSPDAVWDISTAPPLLYVCTTGSTNPADAVWSNATPYVSIAATVQGAEFLNSSSTVATFTATQVVASSQLGGTAFLLSNLNLTINLGTTGAGGMDTGSPPTAADLSVYVIYDPSTATAALLACAGSESNGPIYTGSHMPAGYTASALVSAVVTSGSGFQNFTQLDRTVYFRTPASPLANGTATTATLVSCAASVPACALSIYGAMSLIPTTAGEGFIAGANNVSPTNGTGWQQVSGNVAGASQAVNYANLPMLTPQTFWYVVAGSGTVELSVTINSYTI